MTFDDMLKAVLSVLPDAVAGEDNDGQVIIYTGLWLKRVRAATGWREELTPIPPDDKEVEDDGH